MSNTTDMNNEDNNYNSVSCTDIDNEKGMSDKIKKIIETLENTLKNINEYKYKYEKENTIAIIKSNLEQMYKRKYITKLERDYLFKKMNFN
jgi:hypothetical protein